jgi:hypothetical protein
MIRSVLEPFDRLGTFEQAAFLTLPLLLLYAEDHWYIKIPVVGLSLAGLIFSYFRKNPFYWFALICFMSIGIYYNWESADNHKYLIIYWCLALFFTHLFSAGEDALKCSARYLIGFAFAFAIIWKFVSSDFINGDFFEYTFLFDERFTGKLKVLGALETTVVDFNLVAEDALTAYDSRLYEVDILTNNKLTLWAKVLAYWTLVLEGMIALCFLLPGKYKLTLFGDIILLLFILSTYLIAPVIGFGWVIATIGFIQCDPSRWKIRISYILVILLLQAYRLPWTAIADSIS